MDIVKFIEEIIAEKAKATNKDLMAVLLDKALTALKALHDQPLDERSDNIIAALKAGHIKQLEDAKKQFSATLDQLEADYKQQLQEQDQEAENLRIQLKEAQEIAAEALDSFNASAGTVSDSFETEVAGQKVKINFGVDFKGTYYSAEELVDNTEVLEQLVEMGSGSITLID